MGENGTVRSNTVYQKKSDLDQFYTSEDVAKLCYQDLISKYPKFDWYLEPSAGTGSFLKLFPKKKRFGLDLQPKLDEIVESDFFDYECPKKFKNVLTCGNPPFGKNSSLAIKFFNKAAEFSNVIAFIVPKTFKKQSTWNKLNLNFHLMSNLDLPKNSFLLDNKPYDVPCCFQIWEKKNELRTIEKFDNDESLLKFVKKNEADFAVRRVGGRAGKATDNIETLSITSHYFLKIEKQNLIKDDLIKLINEIDFTEIITATAGVKSLSKLEFMNKLKELVK